MPSVPAPMTLVRTMLAKNDVVLFVSWYSADGHSACLCVCVSAEAGKIAGNQ